MSPGAVDLSQHVPFFEASTAAVVVSVGGRIRYLNPRTRTLFGVTTDEGVVGSLSTDWWFDTSARDRYAQAMAVDGQVSEFEACFRRQDGSLIWCVVSGFVGAWEGQTARCSTFLDVTRAKETEARAIENERKYRLLAENVQDVIWTMDARTLEFTYVSPSIEGLRGISVAESMAEPLERSMTPESYERAHRHVVAALEGEPGAKDRNREVYDQPCRDGSIKHVEITATLVRDEARAPVTFVGVSRDVTARVIAEREQARLLADLRKALDEVKTLSGFVPICAHCKRVRDDAGFWRAVERWIAERSKARFSHGICPSCAAIHFPRDDD